MSSPNGRRLLAIREMRGINQTEMAATLQITQPSLSQIEKAERPLSSEVLSRAVEAYGMPEGFFHVLPTVLDVSVATFRKSSSARVRDERRIVRLYREAARVFAATSQASGYHESKIPREVADLDIDAAAAAIRRLAGLAPTAPIPNMVRFLERLGVGVVNTLDTSTVDEHPAHSGISIPHPELHRPLIALPSSQGRGDAIRFTLAHELAHLIWDQSLVGPTKSTRSPEERRAHAFAGALLLPPEALQQRVTESLNLVGYLPIKAEFGISVGAIIMAAKRAGIIASERARSLQIQLSSRGWRDKEPVDVALERPLLFGQTLQRATGGTAPGAEEFTGLPAEILERWTHIELLAPPIELSAWRSRSK